MKVEGILVTSHLNRKGYRVTREAIEECVASYKKRKTRIPILLAHDYTLGILGIVDTMWVKELEDGECAACYSGYIFDDMPPDEVFELLKLVEPHIVPAGKINESEIIGIGKYNYVISESLV